MSAAEGRKGTLQETFPSSNARCHERRSMSNGIAIEVRVDGFIFLLVYTGLLDI